MNQTSKRSLRERKANKNFESDNSQLDPYGYNRHPYSRDSRTPSQILNAEAKMLVKFINSANKASRQAESELRRKDEEKIREPVAVRGTKARQADHPLQTKKKEDIALVKAQLSKKQKDWQQPKTVTNTSNSDSKYSQKNDAFLSRIKNMSMESATNMRLLEMNITKDKPENPRDKASKPDTNSKKNSKQETSKQKIVNSGNARVLGSEGATTPFEKDSEKLKKIHEVEDRLNLQRSDFSGRNKIFKRSAYHVAIAYHIYLRKLAQKGPITGQIDPTFHARRLKEGMSGLPY